jgi:hypothetical protein
VQKADSSPPFDDRDAALQSGASEKRVAMQRRVTRLFLGTANRLNEEAAALAPLSSASLGIIRPLAAKLPSEPAPTGHGKLEIDFPGTVEVERSAAAGPAAGP